MELPTQGLQMYRGDTVGSVPDHSNEVKSNFLAGRVLPSIFFLKQ